MKFRDIFLAVLVTLIWGSYFTASKIILISFPPLLFAGLRFLLLFIITSPFIFKDRPPIKTVFGFSIIMFLNMIALNHAIGLCMNLSPIILINELVVPLSTLFGIIVFKERFYMKDALGIALAFIGFTLVIKIKTDESTSSIAIILTVIASLLFAGYNLIAKKLASFNIITVISLSSLFTFPMFLILSFFQENWPSLEEIQPESIKALIYIVLIGSLLSHFLWMYLLNKYPLGKVVPFTLLSPLFGCIISVITLGEKIKNNVLWGGALVMLGLILIELNKNYAQKK